MKVAYIYNLGNKHTYAGESIALGFQNAFKDIGFNFRFFSTRKLQRSLIEKINLCIYNPDLIFTSVENIGMLPLDYLKQKKIILWGQFYSPCDYESQIEPISETTKQLLKKYRDKHEILIWSQHDEKINERFFSGYMKELGLMCVQLLHAADKTQAIRPNIHTIYDFIWVGNIGHRKTRYEEWITPLKNALPNYLEFNEHSMLNPIDVSKKQYYAKSFISPNLHTPAQIKHKILLNERVFTATLSGGFQICDNPMARKYFTNDELLIASTPEEMIDLYNHYQKYPEKRIEMIERMSEKILNEHTYHHRIKTILSSLKIDKKI